MSDLSSVNLTVVAQLAFVFVEAKLNLLIVFLVKNVFLFYY